MLLKKKKMGIKLWTMSKAQLAAPPSFGVENIGKSAKNPSFPGEESDFNSNFHTFKLNVL